MIVKNMLVVWLGFFKDLIETFCLRCVLQCSDFNFSEIRTL